MYQNSIVQFYIKIEIRINGGIIPKHVYKTTIIIIIIISIYLRSICMESLYLVILILIKIYEYIQFQFYDKIDIRNNRGRGLKPKHIYKTTTNIISIYLILICMESLNLVTFILIKMYQYIQFQFYSKGMIYVFTDLSATLTGSFSLLISHPLYDLMRILHLFSRAMSHASPSRISDLSVRITSPSIEKLSTNLIAIF